MHPGGILRPPHMCNPLLGRVLSTETPSDSSPWSARTLGLSTAWRPLPSTIGSSRAGSGPSVRLADPAPGDGTGLAHSTCSGQQGLRERWGTQGMGRSGDGALTGNGLGAEQGREPGAGLEMGQAMSPCCSGLLIFKQHFKLPLGHSRPQRSSRSRNFLLHRAEAHFSG